MWRVLANRHDELYLVTLRRCFDQLIAELASDLLICGPGKMPREDQILIDYLTKILICQILNIGHGTCD